MGVGKVYGISGGYLVVLEHLLRMYWVYDTHVVREVLNEVAYEGLSEVDDRDGLIRMIDRAKGCSEKLLQHEESFELLKVLLGAAGVRSDKA